MKRFFRVAVYRFRVVSELLSFLWRQRLWWLLPMVIVLLVFGLLAMLGTATGLGPLIYALF